MSTSKMSADSSTGRDVDDAPPHAPGQLPDTPSEGGDASGSGGAGGSDGSSSGEAKDAPPPHPDPDAADDVPLHTEALPQGDEAPGTPVEHSGTARDVELDPRNDPSSTAAAFASVDQLLVMQQVIADATAKYITQGE
ncbi:unnamed protein product [Phytophthora fragariaefolia]|uniref:Unnamed protein product n=1 Tax=Phytophthora fragariaefolia TaxID=1490495 RepID=A0A9W6Y429_9STRA|nr:unnamed protein product [Phytophthora fragariaefolia]